MSITFGQLFKEFGKRPGNFKVTHAFHAYYFDVGYLKANIEELGNISMGHFILGEGYIYDWHNKHICVESEDFWNGIQLSLFGSKALSHIDNGDILHVSNYIHEASSRKVTHMRLTNALGQFRSHHFYADDIIYEAVRDFNPSKEESRCL